MKNQETRAREHRDCLLGVSFPLAAINLYPHACGSPSPALEKVRVILVKLHKILEMGTVSRGEDRDIEETCAAAIAHGCYYEDTETPKQQLARWRVMWFVSEYAFGDAYSLSGYWKLKAPSLWKDAKGYIDRITTTMCRYHPAEEEEACKIWCCFASPYRNPNLVKTWEQN